MSEDVQLRSGDIVHVVVGQQEWPVRITDVGETFAEAKLMIDEVSLRVQMQVMRQSLGANKGTTRSQYIVNLRRYARESLRKLQTGSGAEEGRDQADH